jgi:hypothetical protein
MSTHVTARPLAHPAAGSLDPAVLQRVSARFGVGFAVAQLCTMVVFALVVLPNAGSVSDPAIERGQGVFDAIRTYEVANYLFSFVGLMLLGFLGVVVARLRAVDRSGVLASVALASGTLLALIWPIAGVLHSVALEVAASGTDLRILAGWDSVAPYCLAFSAIVRAFFVGALVLGLRATGAPRWLVGWGTTAAVLGVVGSSTLVVGAMFPVLAVSTLLYETWIGVVAWRWTLRS